MKTLMRTAALAAALALPGAAQADPVDALDAVLGDCRARQDASCADAMWAYADVSPDDRLTVAELTRFWRMVSEWTVVEQARREAIAQGVDPDSHRPLPSDRLAAAGAAFLGGPLAAHLIVANFDYDGDGVLARSEVFADSGPGEFVRTVMAELERLPQHAGALMMRVLEAQKELGLGEGGTEAPGITVAPEALGPTFALENVRKAMRVEGGGTVVVVSGDVVNVSDAPAEVPALIAEIVGDGQRVLARHPFRAWQSRLGPGESTRFSQRITDIPVGAADVRVVLEAP